MQPRRVPPPQRSAHRMGWVGYAFVGAILVLTWGLIVMQGPPTGQPNTPIATLLPTATPAPVQTHWSGGVGLTRSSTWGMRRGGTYPAMTLASPPASGSCTLQVDLVDMDGHARRVSNVLVVSKEQINSAPMYGIESFTLYSFVIQSTCPSWELQVGAPLST